MVDRMNRQHNREEGRQMMEMRREAERFVLAHKDLITTASKDEVNAAIGKIGRALWELKQAQVKLATR